MPRSTRNGVSIYYEVAGEGPPVVLVHANPFDHRLWMYQTARWSAFHAIVAVDIRGYGRSDKPEAPFSLEDMANDVIGVMDDLAIDRAVVGGCSVGSGMALIMGLDHPERCAALVLVGGASRPGANVSARVAGYAGDVATYQREHLRACTAPGFGDGDPGGWVLNMFNERADTLSGASIGQIFRARGSADLQARLPAMKPPVIVVNGIHDISLDAGLETARLIPGAVHSVIPGSGHACQIENPAGFDAAVLPFLAKHGLWGGASGA